MQALHYLVLDEDLLLRQKLLLVLHQIAQGFSLPWPKPKDAYALSKGSETIFHNRNPSVDG